jgi:hypothetical protein
MQIGNRNSGRKRWKECCICCSWERVEREVIENAASLFQAGRVRFLLVAYISDMTKALSYSTNTHHCRSVFILVTGVLARKKEKTGHKCPIGPD